MTSKWIEDLRRAIDNDDLFELYIEDKLNEIDKLFKRAMNLVDDPNLYDAMRKEINGD